MPLRFTDIPMFLTPMASPEIGASAISAATQNLLQARQQKEMSRYHDMMAAQENRRMDAVIAGQNQANEQAKRKMALDILKTKMEHEKTNKDAMEKTLLDAQKLALIDPNMAKALLSNRGMLIDRQTQQPQVGIEQKVAPLRPTIRLPQEAIDIGITPEKLIQDIAPLAQAKTPSIATEGVTPGGPILERPTTEPIIAETKPQLEGYQSIQPSQESYMIQSGGREYAFDRNKEIAKRANTVKDLFEKKLEVAGEEDREVAARILSLAPKTVEITNGDTQSAVEMLLGQYYKELANEKADKKKKVKGSGIPRDFKGNASLYIRFLNDGHRMLKESGFFEADEASKNLKSSYKSILSDNGTKQWNAIRAMIKTYESGRLSDFDVKMARGYMSLWEKWSSWFTENKGGTLSDDVKKQIAESIRASLIELHERIKENIAEPMQNRIDMAPYGEEKKAYEVLYDMHFNKPDYAWYKPIKTQSNPSSDVLDELEKKYGGK